MVDIIIDDDDDVGLHVLGCRVDILGTNCRKTLKSKDEWGGGGRFSFSTCNHVRGAARRLLLDKKTFCRWGCILLRVNNDDHLLTTVNGPVMRAAYIKKKC